VDRVNRLGLKVADLLDKKEWNRKLRAILELKNHELKKLYDHPPLAFEPIYEEYLGYFQKIYECVAPVEEMLACALKNGERLLFEGAQGTFLDVSFGTFPFVTSSCTLSGGLAIGAGVGPSAIGHTIGVAKAYTTRVGNGPMPTELTQEELSFFKSHEVARELGTTTGRKRRIGWLDCCLLRQAVRLNGIQSLALTKLDVLDDLNEIRICNGYKGFSRFPVTDIEWRSLQPIYETHPGWKESTHGVEVYGDLPPNAKAYVRRIEALCEVPVSLVSVGPEREKTLWLDRFFE
ncbi:MAG: adenylosuccinate synthetase, partial [Chlamydiia bacterium]|nr:adenylosuccinate synthetase [Chlamydiia bacterium]